MKETFQGDRAIGVIINSAAELVIEQTKILMVGTIENSISDSRGESPV